MWEVPWQSMKPKTLTIQLNDEQLPILPVEPEAHLSFTTHADGNELELTGNRAGLLLLAKAALGMAETLRGDGFHIHLDDLYRMICNARYAAFFAPLIATVATGIPDGICTIE